jgi:hypothetical protein
MDVEQERLIFRIVYLGFVISGVISLLVVGGVIGLALFRPADKIPDVLQNWGGVIVGFYFGTFVSLIKDYMKIKEV